MFEDPQWVDDAQTVLMTTFGEPLTVEEIIQTLDKASSLLDSVDHRAHFIFNGLTLRLLPSQFHTGFPAFIRHSLVKHRNLDQVVVVINNTFLENTLTVLRHFYSKIVFVRTMDEAYRAVGIEPPLPDLKE